VKADKVTAVVVTRGDVAMNRLLGSLPYSRIIVWNDQERGSKGVYGRYLAMQEADTHVVYFQDDDIVFTEHDKLMAKFQWTRMVVNMPSPWYERNEFPQRNECRVGAGSLTWKTIPQQAIDYYLKHYDPDPLFYERADVITGMLCPHVRYDFGYHILPWATDPGRINTTPGAQERKEEMQNRVAEIRPGFRLFGDARRRRSL
jgi:hypothetical protein